MIDGGVKSFAIDSFQVSGSAAPSLLSVMLSKTLSSTEEHLLKHTAGILYVAGIDTVSPPIEAILAAY